MALRFNKWLLVTALLLCWLVNSSMVDKAAAVHPFYVSVTEVEHNAGAKTLEISCKMFAEDVEEVLKKNYQVPIDIFASTPTEKTKAALQNYMQRHLQLQADGKTVALQFVGFEKESESVYCYLEGSNVAAVKKLVLNNSILQDFTADQINIMHVTVAGNRKSHKLNYPDKMAVFQF